MGITGYADAGPLLGNRLPQVWSAMRRPWFGDAVVVVFLLVQCFDGVLTYIGVLTYGTAIEANPIIAALMEQLGKGTALLSAKVVAAVLGIALHLRQVHSAVALLAAFYLVAAILPWTLILFF